jgi:hypothetical protein
VEDRVVCVQAEVVFAALQVTYAADTVGYKLQQMDSAVGVSVLDFGADPTGVALSNDAFNAAKAVSNTLLLPAGTYRLEGWTAQDVRLIGMRSSGGNFGANEQTVIEGSGDLFVGANNFAMEHLVMRNSSSGTRGKLVTVANLDTQIGPFIDVEFRKATHHIYHGNAGITIVNAIFQRCRFSDASVYSRYYLCNLFRYSEEDCYTQANVRGLFLGAGCTAFKASGVFELQEEGAIYTSAPGSSTVFNAKFGPIHFENNGTVTPSPDLTIAATADAYLYVELDTCSFNLPTIPAGCVALAGDNIRLIEHNCRAVSYSGQTPPMSIYVIGSGWTTGTQTFPGGIAVGSVVEAASGFQSGGAMSTTITGSATTLMALPPSHSGRMVLVFDDTTSGMALLFLYGTTVTVVSSTLTAISFSVAGGFLKANTTGGASSRVLYWTSLST